MAENNAKNYEGGTKGLGSVKTDVVSPALQKLTELSVKLRALTDNILEIKAKKVREEEERRAEEERRKEAEELLRIQKEEAEKKKAEEEAANQNKHSKALFHSSNICYVCSNRKKDENTERWID